MSGKAVVVASEVSSEMSREFPTIINDITPEETEDEGAGGEEVEDGDLDLANIKWKTEHLETKKLIRNRV